MRVLIDTGIIMDALTKREPFFGFGKRTIALCGRDDVDGYIAAHTVANLFYLMRHDYTNDEPRDMLLNLLDILKVEQIDEKKIRSALRNRDFRDFEDCLQSLCGNTVAADYIVTRNGKHYGQSEVPVVSSEEFCKMFGE